MSHESNKPADAFNNFIMNYINTKIQINFDGSFKLTHNNFTLRKVVNICIVNEIILWPYILGANFVIGISLFGAIKFAKNDDPNKCKLSGYGTGFNARGRFSLSNGSEVGKNVITFGADMSSSVRIANKKKDIMILRKGPTNIKVNAEEQYSISSRKNLVSVCIIME